MIERTPLSVGYALEEKLNFLRMFTNLGFHCVYLHFPLEDGGCTCANPDCESVGKHPIQTGWTDKATADYNLIRLPFERNPNYNIGIVTGKKSNIIVADFDGPEGIKTYEERSINDPDTLTFKTGKGLHAVYRYDQELADELGGKVSNRVRLKNLPVDIRGDNGFIVAPGSLHPNGNRYELLKDAPISEIPIWLRELLRSKPQKERSDSPVDGQSKIEEGQRNCSLFKMAVGAHTKTGLGLDYIEPLIQKVNLERCDPPLPESEVNIICLSACKYFPEELEQIPEELEEKAEEAVINNKIKAEAKRILAKGKPLIYVLEVFNEYHVGDTKLAKIIFYCNAIQQVLNSQGFHPNLHGDSGYGKSHTGETAIHLMPEEAYIKTSLSPKALFYHEILPGTIIFCDDYKQNDEIDSVIKQSSSNFHAPLTHLTTYRGKAVTLTMPPQIVWMITSVDADQDIQVLNRSITADVDDSDDANKQVVEFIKQQAIKREEGFPVTDEVLICREIIRLIKSKFYRVKIPYANKINWKMPENRRNLPIFLDTIKANAVWNREKRETDAEGYLIATPEDFHDALDLFNFNKEAMKTKLTKTESKLIKLVYAAPNHELTREEASEQMQVSAQRITQLCRGEKNKTGLMQKVVGFTYERRSVKTDANEYADRMVLKVTSAFNPSIELEEMVYLEK